MNIRCGHAQVIPDNQKFEISYTTMYTSKKDKILKGTLLVGGGTKLPTRGGGVRGLEETCPTQSIY